MGVYNVTYNYPVSMELANNKDERDAFLNFMNNRDGYKGSIFIFDRGFVDNKLFTYMDDNEINYICRLRGNSKMIKPDSNDHIVKDNNNNQIRIITYTINNNNYYLATNLLNTEEYTINTFMDLYHKRWGIEEFFKFIKSNTSFDNMLEKDKTSIKKTIYTQLIVSRIVDLLAFIQGPHPDKSYVVNKKLLAEAVYENFLLNFLYANKFNRRTIRTFMKTAVKYTHSQGGTGKQYERKSSKPYSKWYIKKFNRKYISDPENLEKIKKARKENRELKEKLKKEKIELKEKLKKEKEEYKKDKEKLKVKLEQAKERIRRKNKKEEIRSEN